MQEEFQIKQINDYEYFVNDVSITFTKDHVIRIITVGEASEKEALAVKEIIQKLSDLAEDKVNVLIDLTQALKPSPKARKVFLSLDDHHKIMKFAMFGAHPVAKVLAHFLLGITNRKDVRFFNTAEEALEWFKS